MSDNEKYDSCGLLKPEYVGSKNAKPDTYKRQYEEARVINQFFVDKTPIQILADDVGTGKTWVAMMALFSCFGEKEPKEQRVKRRHAVVIVPSRLVAAKWMRELIHFNRNFVKDPEKTAIDQLGSTKDLLEALQHDIKSKVPTKSDLSLKDLLAALQQVHKSNVPKPDLSLNDLFRSSNNTKRQRRTEAPETFLLHLWKTTLDLEQRRSKKNESKSLPVDSDRYNKDFRHYGPLAAMLPQQKTERLILNFRRYISRFKQRNKNQKWYASGFDREAWSVKTTSKVHWTTWVKCLQDLLEEALSPSNKQKVFCWLNNIVQIASVLWDVDQHGSRASAPSALTAETAEKLQRMFKNADSDSGKLHQIILSVVQQGLPESSRSVSQFDHLRQKTFTEDQHVGSGISATEAQRIVELLAAYADRLKTLSGFDINLSHRLMDLYAAAGVFHSVNDLNETIVAQQASPVFWARLADFLQPILSEKLSRKNSKHLQRLSQVILQLVDYEVSPGKTGSTFWDEQPKERAIHVIYMNDLKDGVAKKTSEIQEDGATKDGLASQSKSKELQETKKAPSDSSKVKDLISLAIVDEAHNWRRRAYGAQSFQQFIQPIASRTLLVTATPLHMGVEDLKSIIDLALGLNKDLNTPKFSNIFGNKSKNKLEDFQNSYQSIFGGPNDQNPILFQASQLQRQIVKEINNLAGNKNAIFAIEEAKRSLESLSSESDKKLIQCKLWKELIKIPALQELSNSILHLHELLNQKFLSSLSLIVNKTRAKKHFPQGPQESTPIATRRYLCGYEADVSALGSLNPPADDAHLLMHDNKGIDNTGADWVDLIGMRLTQMLAACVEEKKNALLLTALPSSYEALKESAEFKSKSLDSENWPESVIRYNSLFKNCFETEKSKSSNRIHPKIARTTEIIFKNLLLGHKTLVFCQRVATAKAITKAMNERCEEFIGKAFNIDHEKTQSDESLRQLFEYAKEFAENNKDRFPSTDHTVNFSAFQTFVESTFKDKYLPADQFDARAVWLVSTALKKAFGDKLNNNRLLSKLSIVEEDSLQGNDEETDAPSATDNPSQFDSEDARAGIRSQDFSAAVCITGEMSDSDRRDSILRNFSSPFFPLVLVCTQVSQEGVDMHKYCRTLILHDLNWNPSILEQRVGRLDRVGSYASELKCPVDIFIPFLADSYDEYQFARVLQRADVQELVFGRNDKMIDDFTKSGEDSERDQYEPDSDAEERDVPLLGNLIRGFFDMDLSSSTRFQTWFSSKSKDSQEIDAELETPAELEKA